MLHTSEHELSVQLFVLVLQLQSTKRASRPLMTASLADTAAGHSIGFRGTGFPDATSVPAMAAFIWGLSTPAVSRWPCQASDGNLAAQAKFSDFRRVSAKVVCIRGDEARFYSSTSGWSCA